MCDFISLAPGTAVGTISHGSESKSVIKDPNNGPMITQLRLLLKILTNSIYKNGDVISNLQHMI